MHAEMAAYRTVFREGLFAGRVVAALDLEQAILSALPSGDIRPIERVSQKGRERQRARPSSERPGTATWTWGEDGDD